MKTLVISLSILSLLWGAAAFSAPEDPPTAGESVNRGLGNVKEGTRQTAEGLSNAAAEAGKSVNAVGKKVGLSLKAATCPVVGNRKTKLYYAKDSKSYALILDGQKYFEDDDRDCFMTEQAARDKGYARTAN